MLLKAIALVCFERAKAIGRAKVSQWLNALNKYRFSAQTTGKNEHAENHPYTFGAFKVFRWNQTTIDVTLFWYPEK